LAPTGAVFAAEGTKEEIAGKLVTYQQFMAKYIVESHQQKVKAVKAAELGVAKKYEDKLRLLTGSSSSTTAEPAALVPALSKETQLYQERNAKVAASAQAGKSRWGDMESARAAQATSTAPVAQAAPAAPAVRILGPVPPEVEAADHGLRADGGVGGYSLAERVAFGANTASSNGAVAVPATLSPKQVLYQKRNAMVTAAAKAGKSRWGEMEIQRVKSFASALPAARAAPMRPEVAAADHGLRNDGGVGGPSLAQRVNLGAQLLGVQ
jgi:hypothetical protein